MGLKPKTRKQVLDYMMDKPKETAKLIEEYELLGDKDFRMNYVYFYEQRGVNLVDALTAVENMVWAIKVIQQGKAA